MNDQHSYARGARRALAGALAALSLATGAIPAAHAQALVPSNVFITTYHGIQIGGMGQPEARASAFAALTDGIMGGGNGLDTFNLDGTGVAKDFVGLQYASPQQFDSITINLGFQFGDGGDWETTPKIYVLKNPLLAGDRVEPNTSPAAWVEVLGGVETTGHVFNPVAPGAGGTINFNLAAIPAADRTGYGWAVGGVDGYSANPGSGMNFISLTEVSATGAAAAAPAHVQSATPAPVNMVSNRYNSLARSNQPLIDDNRGQAFAALTNGLLDRNANLGQDGYDTFEGNNPATDFVGLQYGAQYRFDTLTVELGQQFGDGGDWDSTPKIFILKNAVDTDKTRPESDPANWLEVTGALETTGHVFSPLATNGAGGTINFDLSAIPAGLRTGYGWAIGGVDGNANAGGGSNFLSLTEVRATGALIPEPTSAAIAAMGAVASGLVRRRRIVA